MVDIAKKSLDAAIECLQSLHRNPPSPADFRTVIKILDSVGNVNHLVPSLMLMSAPETPSEEELEYRREQIEINRILREDRARLKWDAS